jgi:hypothetical protein
MSATTSAVVRYGLAFVAAIVGFAIAGGGGLGLGVGLVLLAPMIWRWFRNRREVSAEYRNAKTAYNENTRTTYRIPLASQVMVGSILSFYMLLFLYSIALRFRLVSYADVEWMRVVQPAVDWLSAFIPALRRMPLDLTERGYADWAPAVQHLMFVAWLSLPLIAVWIILDVLVINRNSWARVRSLYRWRRWAIMLLLSAIVIAAMVPILFFGLTAASDRKGLAGLPGLAGCFFAMVSAFFMLTVSCNVFLTWSRTSGGDPAVGQATTGSPSSGT